MEYYETGIMTKENADSFITWFYEVIGTDAELNEIGDNEFYVLCSDLTQKEVNTIRAYEKGLTK